MDIGSCLRHCWIAPREERRPHIAACPPATVEPSDLDQLPAAYPISGVGHDRMPDRGGKVCGPRWRGKLVSVDTVHACIAIRAANLGWTDIDPANDMIAGGDHVTVAGGCGHGAVGGIMAGGSLHTFAVMVDRAATGDGSTIRQAA